MKWIYQPQFKIVFIYIILGLAWIFLSDYVTDALFGAGGYVSYAQTVKGIVFIVFTGLLLFFLIKRDIGAVTAINQKLVKSYQETICGWVNVMDLRHKETHDHSARVTMMTLELAKQAGITDKKELDHIERGAILHDIGKIGIPDSILIKPDRLDEKEWVQMRKHPGIGYDILSDIDFLQSSMDIPYYHHEKWDGSGYPFGLKGEEIPIAARIFAVIDVWDALTHARVYKSAWPEDKVLNYLKDQSGKHFDPKVVQIFTDHYDEIKQSAKAAGANGIKTGCQA